MVRFRGNLLEAPASRRAKGLSLAVTAVALLRGADAAPALADEPGELPACTPAAIEQLKDARGDTGWQGAAVPGAEVERLPDGGRSYTYKVGTIEVEQAVPPRGFDPLAASDAELAEYQYPERPDQPEALAAWEHLVGDAKYPVAPGGCRGGGASAGPVANAEADTPLGATNAPLFGTDGVRNEVWKNGIWSGFVDEAQGHPSHFASISGEYHAPNGFADPCPAGWVSSWVGLGGVYSSHFMQAGTWIHNTGEMNSWWEIYGGNNEHYAVQNWNISLKPGDLVQDAVGYAPFQGGSMLFWVVNHRSGWFLHEELHNVAGFYNGSTAEFIDERPSSEGQPLNLRRFSPVNWENGRVVNAVTGEWEPISGPERTRAVMRNAFGETLAEPSLLTGSGSFTDTWRRCS